MTIGDHRVPGAAGLHRRLIVNLAWIGSSQAVISLLGLTSLALTARALGPAGLGVLAFIEAYARMIARLVHPEPWQALIQHGTRALERGDAVGFGHLVWLSLLADLAGGLLATGIGILCAAWVAGWMQVAAGQAPLLMLAAAATLIAPRPTAMGLLRIYDRFDLLARIDMTIALLRLAMIAVTWWAGLGLSWFVALMVLWTVMENVIPMALALREMRRRGHAVRHAPLRQVLRDNPGLMRLFVNSNVTVTLRQMRQRLDIILLAGVLPASALGLYQLARRIGDAALRIGRPLTQVFMPEFARLAARQDYHTLRRLMLAGSLGLGGMLLVVMVPLAQVMDQLLPALFGQEFGQAAGTVNIMAAAMALYMASMSIGPAMISLGRDRAMTGITAVTTLLFFMMLVPGALLWQAEGAAATHLASNALWLAGTTTIAWRTLRDRQGRMR